MTVRWRPKARHRRRRISVAEGDTTSRRRRMTRLALACVAAAIVVLAVGAAVLPARGEVPADLGVYSGRAIATPIGVVSRVPAETAGGVLYSEARLEIGKTRAIAAGATLGELGEAFLVTTVKGYTNPALVNAQYPPSNVYPPEARFQQSVRSGGSSVFDLHAVANDQPSAAADAIGGSGGMTGVLRIGGGTSRTRTEVKKDGTVLTTAVSSIQDVVFGPELAPILTIGTMTSTASVEVPFGGKPKSSLNVQMTGAQVAGTPVTITQDGINILSAGAVPASSLLQVNQYLAQLDQYGLSVRAVPVDKHETDTEGTVSGAALQFRTIAPASLALPTDIGKDETFLLGQVIANAAGRKRQPFEGGTLAPSTEVSGLTTSADLPLATEPVSGVPDLAAPAPLPAALGGEASPLSSTDAGAPAFQLPRRSRNVVSDSVLDGYRFIILTAVVAAAAYLLRNRTRLSE